MRRLAQSLVSVVRLFKESAGVVAKKFFRSWPKAGGWDLAPWTACSKRGTKKAETA